jgi:hypothetical protein
MKFKISTESVPTRDDKPFEYKNKCTFCTNIQFVPHRKHFALIRETSLLMLHSEKSFIVRITLKTQTKCVSKWRSV